ncbi:MAG TPA: linear amide C-N hydrolase [Thermoanaerobaculia bacterium]|jgi:choloylglycine hydrolase|nr:linear amide C-N hydrolase [Thermoanaerobaculia bacterium]
MLKRKVSGSVLLVLGMALAAREAHSCTTFCLRHGGEVLYGKNYDWHNGNGYLMVNQRGATKAAMVGTRDRPASWVSKYGSVTFNQWGREFPSGGMNEAGLVVELMWLDATRYPNPDDRPALGALEWIQYQLDRFERVDDVVRQAARTRVVAQAPLHYLVCERSGRCATIEFLDGRLAAHSGASLPVSALANDTYADSVKFLRSAQGQAEGDGGRYSSGRGSLERFARASAMMERYAPTSGFTPVQYAFNILDRVSQGSFTQWSIVYDLRNRKIHFKTRENRQVRSVNLKAFDFSCGGKRLALDLESPGAGDVTLQLAPYTPEKNRSLVVRSYEITPQFRDTPKNLIAAMADHPERVSCARQR